METVQNLVDDVLRGLYVYNLIEFKRWWNGLEFVWNLFQNQSFFDGIDFIKIFLDDFEVKILVMVI